MDNMHVVKDTTTTTEKKPLLQALPFPYLGSISLHCTKVVVFHLGFL